MDERTRQLVFEKYGKECTLCGVDLRRQLWIASYVSSDPIKEGIPLELNSVKNLRPCCLDCDLKKGKQNLHLYNYFHQDRNSIKTRLYFDRYPQLRPNFSNTYCQIL